MIYTATVNGQPWQTTEAASDRAAVDAVRRGVEKSDLGKAGGEFHVEVKNEDGQSVSSFRFELPVPVRK